VRHPRATTLVALGVVVSGSVAMASPASAASATQKAATQKAFVTATTQSPATSLDALNAPFAASRAGSPVIRTSALRATTTTVWSDHDSVRSGDAVHIAGTVTYGANQLRARSHVVDLQIMSDNTWKAVESRATSSDGYVAFTVTPTRSSTYRLSYSGAEALEASDSPPKTVTVTRPSPVKRSSSSSPISSPPATVSAGYSAVTTATGRGAQVAAAAAAKTGKPYVYGAAGPNAFDCSGLTQYSLGAVGISVPHNADAQKSYGKAVSQSAALPGDLVFFLSGGYAYHVAIYAGGGYMYDAPNSGSTVGKHAIYSGTVSFRRLV
jgi:peptidoglycan DL-endopeptidase CwlO